MGLVPIGWGKAGCCGVGLPCYNVTPQVLFNPLVKHDTHTPFSWSTQGARCPTIVQP